ncbi:MAG TPA: cytochrome C [Ramlibacter sp.]|uniref:cytochrome C n=1 Tax=Ramlibacter sp. TaxID=1917967 RepID=UPI002CF7DE23|nr:cytochrome C [Ramlibacter sp.]HVZ43700.1 cytochrome C [Ramlibacter sp.]
MKLRLLLAACALVAAGILAPHDARAETPVAGVHGRIECAACHTGAAAPTKAEAAAGVKGSLDCASCHTKLRDEGRAAASPGMSAVARNLDDWKQSFHARPDADDKTKPKAACADCHKTHDFRLPPAKDSPAYAQFRMGIPQTCGNKCHDDQLEAYQSSVHAKVNAEKKDGKAAVCTDCHSAHSVSNTSADRFKLSIATECGSCHKERLETFRDTFHGRIVSLGYPYTAKCYDCHGSHEILKVSDPKSKVNPANRMKTCASCHNPKKGLPDVPAGFASYQPHANPHDLAHYPQVTLAWLGMAGLLVGTFAFFWVHTLLWFWREWRERQAHGGDVLVRLDEVPEALRAKHVVRFTPALRIAHILFAVSLMVLTLTGMPVFYAEAPWAAGLMRLLGGPHVSAIVHRVSAVVFSGVFFWHLFYVAWRVGRNWRTFNWLGPDSLIPWIPDLKDILAMFKWFFGKGPRPKFDRWTYWEKFDYWAPFWGVTIIGASGLVMWLPQLFGAFLPGWVFNVAAILHGEEAFLAVVFLFTVHFFNNHFRPDKFPVEVVMFTGTFPLEAFKREHALEYERLVASGELERRLVDAPARWKVTGSKALAFVLIATGLALLTIVGIGFFTAH